MIIYSFGNIIKTHNNTVIHTIYAFTSKTELEIQQTGSNALDLSWH